MKKNYIYLTVAVCALCFGFTRSGQTDRNTQAGAGSKPSNQSIAPFALMELYTSEGCSNCPPAYKVVDAFLKYGRQSNQHIYLLDFHVDYFNDPWVDPYSSARNTARQESYARIFPGEGAFTPQMIVNGSQVLLGSNPKKVDAAVTNALKIMPSAKIEISTAEAGKDGYVEVKFETQNIPADSMTNIALVQNTIVQKVLSGENAGKTLTHHNVVRALILVPAKDGVARIPLPESANGTRPAYSIIAFRQDMNTMKIVAASGKEVE